MSLFLQRLGEIRLSLESVFAPDTASPANTKRWPPSAGHCAAVAVIVNRIFGGEYRSAVVSGESHWFNRIQFGGKEVDVDLTGDQFGRDKIQAVICDQRTGELYPDARQRRPDELRWETIERAELLASRAGLELPKRWPRQINTNTKLAWVGPPPSGACEQRGGEPHRWTRAVSLSGWECISCCAPRPAEGAS